MISSPKLSFTGLNLFVYLPDGTRRIVEVFPARTTVGDVLHHTLKLMHITNPTATSYFELAQRGSVDATSTSYLRYLPRHRTLQEEGITANQWRLEVIVKLHLDAMVVVWNEDEMCSKVWYVEQCQRNIVSGEYITNERDAVRIAALYLQITVGDWSAQNYFETLGFDRLMRVMHPTLMNKEYWTKRLHKIHRTLRGMAKESAVQMYLLEVRRCSPHFGMTFFNIVDADGRPFALGVAEDGLFVFSSDRMTLHNKIPMDTIQGWEQCAIGIYLKLQGHGTKMTLINIPNRDRSKEIVSFLTDYATVRVTKPHRTPPPPPPRCRPDVGANIDMFPTTLMFAKNFYLERCMAKGLEVAWPIIDDIDHGIDNSLQFHTLTLEHLTTTLINDDHLDVLFECFPSEEMGGSVELKKLCVSQGPKSLFTEMCVTSICSFMSQWAWSLAVVDLSYINLMDREHQVGAALRELKKLETLTLKSCFLTSRVFATLVGILFSTPNMILELDVSNNRLTSPALVSIASALESTSVILLHLNVSNNNIDAKGLDALIAVQRRRSRELRSLSVFGNPIDVLWIRAHAKDLVMLCDYIDLSGFELTALDWMKLVEGAGIKGSFRTLVTRDSPTIFSTPCHVSLSDSLTSSLRLCHIQELDFCGCQGSGHSELFVALASALLTNETIQTLRLKDNQLGDHTNHGDIPECWKDVIRHNTSLLFLDLSNNNLSTTGTHNVLLALCSNRALLTVLLDSNQYASPPTPIISVLLRTNKTLRALSMSRMVQPFSWDVVVKEVEDGLQYCVPGRFTGLRMVDNNLSLSQCNKIAPTCLRIPAFEV